MLRGATTPLDRTRLGHWDRYPLLIGTVFERYARVFNGPQHVKVAFLPVTYCTTARFAVQPAAPGGIIGETMQRAS